MVKRKCYKVCIKPRWLKRWVCGVRKFSTPAEATRKARKKRTRFKVKKVCGR